MKLAPQQKISAEDLKEAPPWATEVLVPALNQLMENVYNVTNGNIDESNTKSQVVNLTISTPSSYPASMTPIKFQSILRTQAIGCQILQCIEKLSFTPVEMPACPAWLENSGQITINTLSGLAASKTYTIRFRLT